MIREGPRGFRGKVYPHFVYARVIRKPLGHSYDVSQSQSVRAYVRVCSYIRACVCVRTCAYKLHVRAYIRRRVHVLGKKPSQAFRGAVLGPIEGLKSLGPHYRALYCIEGLKGDV